MVWLVRVTDFSSKRYNNIGQSAGRVRRRLIALILSVEGVRIEVLI